MPENTAVTIRSHSKPPEPKFHRDVFEEPVKKKRRWKDDKGPRITQHRRHKSPRSRPVMRAFAH